MSLSAPLASPLLITILAGAAAVLVETGACATQDSQTPTCTPNVDQYGEHAIDGGCENFAVCAAGPPADCCKNADGSSLTGNGLANCLYGYGACASLVTTIDSSGNLIMTCSASYDAGGAGGSGGAGTGGSGGSGADGGADGD
jgi:uncharacterized membrane protein YgcG